MASYCPVGQIAFEVEQEIVKYILKGTGIEDKKWINIDSLERVINSGRPTARPKIFTSLEQIQKAAENWDHLDVLLNCDNTLYQAIEEFKSCGFRKKKADNGAFDHQIVLRSLKHLHEEDRNVVLQMLKALDFLRNNAS